jgi:glycosyltransferase involved in cell wall biosynthesis
MEYIDSTSENIPLKGVDSVKRNRVFMSARKVSIITPTFNHGKFIADCIESVLQQTIKSWEMIIIDDGSTDDTPEIVSRYNDPRIKYIRKEHRGIKCLGENYNYALQMSKGEFVLILEGDDFIPPRRIEMQLPVFEDVKVVLSHGKYVYSWLDRTFTYSTPFKKGFLNNQPLGSALKLFLQGFNFIGTQSVMIRKSTLLDVGGFEQPSYLPLVDYPTWMKVALKGRFAFIPEVLGYWRRHPLSITINRNESIFYGFLRYCDEFVSANENELCGLRLKRFMSNRGGIAFLSLAWIALVRGEWEKALELSKKSWERREVMDRSFKLKTIIALIGARFHLDLPGLFKKLGNRFDQRCLVMD